MLKPLSTTTSPIAQDEGKVEIKWDDVDIRLGAVETIFELIGVLVVAGGPALSVSTNVMASWIYDRFFKKADPKPSNGIKLFIEKPDGTRVIIEATSEEKIKLSLDKHLNVKLD